MFNRTGFIALFTTIALLGLGIGYWKCHRGGCFTSHAGAYSLAALEGKDNIIPLAIMGSGPAGLAAALYGARGGIHTVIFEGDKPGGQLMETGFVENWPGLPKKLGRDLIASAREQAQTFGAHIIQDAIIDIDLESWPFALKTKSGKTFHALALIVATGATPRKLGIPGEDQYWGKGISACATCDAPFYKDKDVFVVGGGDSAFEEAILLAPYTRKITLLVRGDQARASNTMQERIKAYPHIAVRYNTNISQFIGDDQHLNAVVLNEKGEKKAENIHGVFLSIGHTPNTKLFKHKVSLDESGHIVLKGRSQTTSVDGIFAAGDVADPRYKQAGIAAGDGVKAALDALAFLRELGFSKDVASKLQAKLFVPDGGLDRHALTELFSADALDKVTKENNLVVVDFITDICPSCAQMQPILEKLAAEWQEAALSKAPKAKFCKINLMKNQWASARFGVQSVPTIVVIKQGTVVARTGALPHEKLAAFFKAAFSR